MGGPDRRSAFARVAGGTVLAVLHVPFLYLAVGHFGKWLIAPAIAAAAAWVAFRPRWESRAPRTRAALAVAYYLAVAAALALPMLFFYLTDTMGFAASVLLAILGATVKRSLTVPHGQRPPARGRSAAGRGTVVVFFVAVAALVATKVALLAPVLIALAVIGGVTIGVLAIARGFAGSSRAAAFFAVVGGAATLQIVAFFDGVPAWRWKDVTDLPFVRPILTVFDADADLAHRLRDRTMVRFAAEDCDGRFYLVGTRGRFPGLFRVPRDGTSGTERLPLAGGSSDNLARDCAAGRAAGRFLVGDFEGAAILDVTIDPFAVEKSTPFPGKRVGLFRRSADGSRLFVVCDLDPNVYRFDPSGPRLAATAFGQGHNAAMTIDAAGANVWRAGIDGTITRYDGASMIERARVKLPGGFFFWMALDETGGHLFVTSTARGLVYELDPMTLAVRRERSVEKGVRFVVHDARRDRLYVGNYFTGDLLVLDPATLSVLGRVYLGPRTRWIEETGAGDALLVASGFGAFSVDLGGLAQYIARPLDRGPGTDAR
jgi:hypothetical protein